MNRTAWKLGMIKGDGEGSSESLISRLPHPQTYKSDVQDSILRVDCAHYQ